MQKFFLVLSLFVLCVSGCTSKKPVTEDEQTDTGAFPYELPVTFTGVIPCQDCERVDLTLNLRPDFIYQLRKTYVYPNGETESEAQMRLWRYEPNEQLIILGKQPGSLKTYRIIDENTLRFMDKENEDVENLNSYELQRAEQYDPFEDIVKIRGMYSTNGKKRFVTECSTGIEFPVDPSGDFYEMDKQYSNTPHQRGESLLVSFQGSLLPTARGKVKRDKDILVVNIFNRIYADQDCSGVITKKGLIGPTWRVVEIHGQPVESTDKVRAPFMTMETAKRRVTGFGSCNRFFGTYLFKGEIFIFNKLASTRMACPGGVSQEKEFFEALDQTESFEIKEDILYLKDNKDETVLTLQAQN